MKRTRFSFVAPNQSRTSRGRFENRPSTTASKRIGSLEASESSMALTVVRAVSVTAAHQLSKEGI